MPNENRYPLWVLRDAYVYWYLWDKTEVDYRVYHTLLGITLWNLRCYAQQQRQAEED